MIANTGVRIIVALTTLTAVACGTAHREVPCTEEISATDVVAKAERFVVDQGYTDGPGEESSFAFEPLDEGTREEIMRKRSGLLNRSAYGHSKREELRRWDVLFTYREQVAGSKRPVGRAVTSDLCGNDMRMVHQGAYLDTAEVVLDPES